MVETAEPVQELRLRLASVAGIADISDIAPNRAVIRLADADAAPQDRRAKLARILISAGLTPLSITARQHTLEDLFLTLAGPRPANGD
jgi:hypothetical protein